MSNQDDHFEGANLTATIAFFATWAFAFVLFNFVGLVLGWIPALVVAVVVYFTAPFLYALIGFLLWMILVVILIVGFFIFL